jgi:hypothetical protein
MWWNNTKMNVKETGCVGVYWICLTQDRSAVTGFVNMVMNLWGSILQGYPRKLLPVTVPGIPSMHICLDFIPELLSQPSLEKQIFAMDLVSHLAVQYALPKSLSVARLAINTLSTLLAGKFLHIAVHLFQVQDLAKSVACCVACDSSVFIFNVSVFGWF